MARRKRSTPAAAFVPPTVGGQPPRYRFFLNPYPDVRFAACPQCRAKTRARKLPLIIHVQPRHLLALNMTCRFCARCDLLIAHQDELESLLAAYFGQHDPEVMGNDYVVAGTMDHADWESDMRGSPTVQDMLGHVYPFLDEVSFEPASPAGEAAPSAEPTGPPGSAPPGAAPERKPDRETVPVRLRPIFDAIVERTDAVCREHLTEEYAKLCRRLAAALARKRPSPLTRGRPEGWACGIAYAIGAVNFLFDPSQKPHFKATELCALFGVSPATGSARASEIRKLFGMSQFDPRWCLPSKLEDNPLVWMIQVNGLLVDARHAPREVQEEALRLGLIPYLPKTSVEW